MAHKKAAWSADNLRDSNPKYRGVKIFGGQYATAWAIIIRQKWDKYKTGKNTYVGNDFTIHAKIGGVVLFRRKKVTRYDGRKYLKTFVDIIPHMENQVEKRNVKKYPKMVETKKETPSSDLSSMTVKDLKAKAKEMKIAWYSTMKKSDLLSAIQTA